MLALPGSQDRRACPCTELRSSIQGRREALQSEAKSENEKFFDRAEKTDVYYEAQLIAASQAKRRQVLRFAGIIKNIQPISVGV
jgi:adenylate cyclase class IV